MFKGNKEERANVASEKRQMQFQREQNSVAVALPEERTELINKEGKSDLLRWQQELGDELRSLVNTLRGYSEDKDGNIEAEGSKKPLCNNRFITDVVIPQCKPFMSRNLINSTFTEDRILCDLKHTSNEIAANMADCYEVDENGYGIQFQNYDIVLRLIKNTIKAGAFRALNGFTKKADTKIVKVLESTFDHPPQKKGMFGLKE